LDYVMDDCANQGITWMAIMSGSHCDGLRRQQPPARSSATLPKVPYLTDRDDDEQFEGQIISCPLFQYRIVASLHDCTTGLAHTRSPAQKRLRRPTSVRREPFATPDPSIRRPFATSTAGTLHLQSCSLQLPLTRGCWTPRCLSSIASHALTLLACVVAFQCLPVPSHQFQKCK